MRLKPNKKTLLSTSRYIELLKKSLIGFDSIGKEELYALDVLMPSWKTKLLKPLDTILRSRNFGLFKMKQIDREKRMNGYDWPANATTMVGMGRLNNVEHCVRTVLKDNVEGDFVETGV